jgi:hypothetical protein
MGGCHETINFMKTIYLYFILFCAFGILSCKKITEEDIKPVLIVSKPIINPIFTPYINIFLEEGKKRGITFLPDQLDITIQLSKYPTVLGNYLGVSNSDTRTIDIDSVWLKYPEPYKEWLFFHELGHLLLKRDHLSTKLPNGEYASLMWSSQNNPDKCTLPIFTGKLRREYYFDELFKPETPIPTWATENSKWIIPERNSQTIVVGLNSWNKDPKWEAWIKNSHVPFSYNLLPNGMRLVVEKQTNNRGVEFPLSDFFPILSTTNLQNYEVHLRYKLYGGGFSLTWKANDNFDNKYFIISNACNEKEALGLIDNHGGGSFLNKNNIQNIYSTNEIILQHKDNYMKIWVNDQLFFQTEVKVAITESPLFLNLYFPGGQYDFEFITVTRL